ncbi:MAG: chromosome partitioning protein ParA [Oscillospiraceae bacterium]|nr:chromosome partitioning protein ParA [Oscillospiraceae bacterium]
MKIKVAVLDKDTNYLQKLVSIFTNKLSDKLEVCSFTDLNIALQSLQEARINVLLVSDSFNIEEAQIPKRCGFAYLVESPDIETFNGQRAVCKYQKFEVIYKTVLEIFSEHVSESIGMRFDGDSSVRVLTFVSPSGGAGSSSAAAACAKTLAAMGKKVLYLNLEQLSSSDLFFGGDGQTDFGDVIFALKSKKSNLSIKLESNVKRDASGVYFYSAPKTALDMLELNLEEIKRLMTDLKLTGSYDDIVFDMDFSLHAFAMEIFKKSASIVFVLDGSELSNSKFLSVYKAFEILDAQDISLLSRVCIFYNKFSNKTGRALDEGIRVLGGAPKYEYATTSQVVEQLVGLGVFQSI